jgi:hypothetical protein
MVEELGNEMEDLVSHPSLFSMDTETLAVCGRWDGFCHRLYHAYQDGALKEVKEGA